MGTRGRQLDVSHALPSDGGFGYLDSAFLANHALVPDFPVFSAVAFVILFGTEDALAKQTVFLGSLRAVVDGFGFRHFPVRPLQNLVGRRYLYSNGF